MTFRNGARVLGGSVTNTVETIQLPTIYASALVNGDYSSFDPENDKEEIENINKIVSALAAQGLEIVDVAEESHFTWHYRLFGGLAAGGDVSVYTAIRRQK